MIYLDLALRGGAITLLVLLALLLWRSPLGWEARASVSALAVTKSAYLILTAAQPLVLGPVLTANLSLLASFTPTTITWLIVTIFLDPPGVRWPWIALSLFTSAALYADFAFPGVFPFCSAIAVLLYAALFVLSLWSTKDDLVECRCRARPGFAASIAGLALILTLSELMGVFEEGSIVLALLRSGGTFVVSLAFACWLLRPDTSQWPGEPLAAVGAKDPADPGFEDPALLQRVKDAMTAGIWREEGLTIGALAAKLSVPEHRLRRAINQGLGHRNFSSFINHARIEAACNILGDPMRTNVTVLEIAYEVGFSSVGPFNRAFRTEVGHSPTEYRRLSLSHDLADSEKSASMAANLH